MCLHVGECIVMPELYVNMHEVVCVHTSVCVAICVCMCLGATSGTGR